MTRVETDSGVDEGVSHGEEGWWQRFETGVEEGDATPGVREGRPLSLDLPGGVGRVIGS
jgi:hypothetical protein